MSTIHNTLKNKNRYNFIILKPKYSVIVQYLRSNFSVCNIHIAEILFYKQKKLQKRAIDL